MVRIQPDFSTNDKFNAEKGFSRIKFGEDGGLLEVELNEMQKISQHRDEQIVKALSSNGFKNANALVLTSGTLVVPEDTIILDGTIIDVLEPLYIGGLVSGDKVYLSVWEDVVAFDSVIKKGGNESGGTVIDNSDIVDVREGAETSRRVQVKVALTKDNTDSTKKYMLIASILDGNKFTDTREKAGASFEILASNLVFDENHRMVTDVQIGNWDVAESNSKEYVDTQIQLVTATGIPKIVSIPFLIKATANGQTDFAIPMQTFDINTDTVIVFRNSTHLTEDLYSKVVINGVGYIRVVEPVDDYTETEISGIVLKNVPIGADGSINGGVLAVGSIPNNRLQVPVPTLAEITTKFEELIGASPDTLDTLNELAQALGNDPNFATTITQLINTKSTEAKNGAIDWVKSFGLGGIAKDISGTNLDDLDAIGFYMGSSVANAPNNGWWFYINLKHDVIYRTQLAIGFSSNGRKLFHRVQQAGVWGLWSEYLTSDHMNQPWGVPGLDGAGKMYPSVIPSGTDAYELLYDVNLAVTPTANFTGAGLSVFKKLRIVGKAIRSTYANPRSIQLYINNTPINQGNYYLSSTVINNNFGGGSMIIPSLAVGGTAPQDYRVEFLVHIDNEQGIAPKYQATSQQLLYTGSSNGIYNTFGTFNGASAINPASVESIQLLLQNSTGEQMNDGRYQIWGVRR